MADIIALPGVRAPFAAGLSWRHEDTRPKAKALRALSLEKGRWGLVRETSAGTIQVGFCNPIDGVTSPAKLRSLAAMVADQHPQPWMGRYRISENRYWYIAVRDGQEVIPDGDRIGTAADVDRIREQHRELGEWTTDLEGTIDDLAEMARTWTRKVTLSDLQRRLWVPVAIVSGVAIAIAAVSAGVVVHNERAAAARKKIEDDNRLALAAAQRAERVAKSRVLPWTHEPMPSDVVRACGLAWRDQDLARGGWMLSSWRCDASTNGISMTSDWERAGGLASEAPGTLQDGGQKAEESVQVRRAFSEPSPLVTQSEAAQRAIWSFAQSNGLTLTMTAAIAKPVLPGATPDEPAVDPWTISQPVFKLGMAPWDPAAPSFDTVPGLRVRGLRWSQGTPQWTVDTTLYTLRASTIPAAHGGPAKPLPGGRA